MSQGTLGRGTGNNGANTLRGHEGFDHLIGLGGNDILVDGAGGARMQGGDGDDLYVVEDARTEVIETGSGRDTVRSTISFTLTSNVEILELDGRADIDGTGNALANRIVGNAGADTLAGGDGNDEIAAGDGGDQLFGQGGADLLGGEAGDDTLSGNAGDDRLEGGDGQDTLVGGGGHDTLNGGAGRDSLYGSVGDDVLVGGDANDQATGGAGDDTFVFFASSIGFTDVITDFTIGSDVISLNGFGAGFGFDDLVIRQVGDHVPVTAGDDRVSLLNADASLVANSDNFLFG